MTENSKAETEIIEHLAGQAGWVRISEIPQVDGLEQAIITLHEDRVIRAEPDVLRSRVTFRGEKGIMIDGEARHLIKMI